MSEVSPPASNAPRSPTLGALLKKQSLIHGDQPAFRFYHAGEATQNLTFAELDLSAQAIAIQLSFRVKAGDRVLLLYSPGLEFVSAFFACMYVGAVAVPVPWGRGWSERQRAVHVAEDAGACLILTTQSLLAEANNLMPALKSVATDQLGDTAAVDMCVNRDADSVAFIQYSSGSTGKPRGVVVRHRSAIRNLELIRCAFDMTRESTVVTWLPHFHDMGLVGTILEPLYVGSRCIMMSPNAFLQRPVRWLELISEYKAEVSGGPNFAYEYCSDALRESSLEGIDLTCWRVAFNGSEPVAARTLDRFQVQFANVGFRPTAFTPCYGLAEATLLVSGRANKESRVRRRLAPANAGCSAEIVSCGPVADAQSLVIVSPELREPVPAETVGEIWLTGECVSDGYWCRCDASFSESLPGDTKRKYFRTGDLGFLADQELYIIGRLDDRIILRGRNLSPEDVELAMQLPGNRLGSSVAFGMPGPKWPQLILLQGVRRIREELGRATCAAIRSSVFRHVSIQPDVIMLVPETQIPRTSSGKLQRGRCREIYASGAFTSITIEKRSDDEIAVTGASSVLDRLVICIGQLLGTEPECVDPRCTLNELGLDSLGIARLSQYILEWSDVSLTDISLSRKGSVNAIAEELQVASTSGVQKTHELDACRLVPLTSLQRHFWTSQVLLPQVSRMLFAAVKIDERLDVAALKRAVDRIGERHPMLRARFEVSAGRPVFTISSEIRTAFTCCNVSDAGDDVILSYIECESKRVVDLNCDPLLRISVLRGATNDFMVIGLHHLVVDYWSVGILLADLDRFYGEELRLPSNPILPPQLSPRSRFAEFARSKQAENNGRDRAERLCCARPLNFPFDWVERGGMKGCPASVQIEIENNIVVEVLKVAKNRGTTPFLVYLAALEILLSRYSNEDLFLVAFPSWGRREPKYADSVGCFVETCIALADTRENPTVAALIDRCKGAVTEALEANVSYHEVVHSLRSDFKWKAAPVTCLLTVYGTVAGMPDAINALAVRASNAEIELPNLHMHTLAVAPQAIDFDLELSLAPVGGRLICSLVYTSDRLRKDTAERFASRFATVLKAISSSLEAKCDAMPITTLDDAKRRRLTDSKCVPFTRGPALLHEYLEEHARGRPSHLAVVDPSKAITYSELDMLANRVAVSIRETGTLIPVAVCLESGVGFVASFFGGFKSGVGIVPLSPSDPSERLAMIVQDVGSEVLITSSRTLKTIKPMVECCASLKHVYVFDLVEGMDVSDYAMKPLADPGQLPPISASAIAYVVYTSGTTGRPKGVPITHANLTPLFDWELSHFDLGIHVRQLQLLAPTFDFGLQEILTTLLFGGTFFAFYDEVRQDLTRIPILLNQHRINTIFVTPSLLSSLLALDADYGCVDRVLIGGEVLRPSLASRAYSRLSPSARIFNGYGPTETAINCVTLEITREMLLDLQHSASVPIGRATGHAELYVVDIHGESVPCDIPGELWVGGPGVASKYLNAPELTKERFVDAGCLLENGASEILYKTGDIVRMIGDDVLEFIGRKDRQLKIRGYRVEPGEVEGVLAAHPSVQAVRVVPTGRAGQESSLIAVIVPVRGAMIDVEDVKTFAKQRLAAHLIPSRIILSEELPFGRHGKIDEDALRSFVCSADVGSELHQNSESEDLVATAWRDVLGIDVSLSRDDSFFDVGGHSLAVIELHTRLERATGKSLSIGELMDSTTVAAMAKLIDGHESRPQFSAPARSNAGMQHAFQRIRDRLSARRDQ